MSEKDADLPFTSANQDIHSINFMNLKLGLLMVLPEKICSFKKKQPFDIFTIKQNLIIIWYVFNVN